MMWGRWLHRSAGIALLKVALDTSLAAAETGKFKVDAATVQVATTDSTLKVTELYDSDGDNFGGWLAGFTLKIAASNVEGDAQSRLDDYTKEWRLGLSLGKEVALDRDKVRVQLEPEWAFKQFKYFPTTAPPSATSTNHSIDVALNAFYYREPTEAAPWALQAKLRLAHDWEDSPAVGIVTPAMPPLPALVTDSRIIDGPVVQDSLTARLFFWKQATPGSEWAVGPSAAATFAGPKGHTSSISTTAIFRGELWLYFMPSTASPANFRIGISPFLSVYAKGEATDGRTVVPGALFQARYGAPIFVY